MPTLSGAELEQELAGGKLGSSHQSIVGIVKKSEERDHIAFSLADCESWTDLPTGLIDEAETIGECRCGDHSHPVVRLRLHEPKSEEGRALLNLLHSAPTTSPDVLAAPGNPCFGEYPVVYVIPPHMYDRIVLNASKLPATPTRQK